MKLRRMIAGLILALTVAVVLYAVVKKKSPDIPKKPGIHYPHSRQSTQTDNLHGTMVPDPYRWLESLDSPETQAWIEAQNRFTADYLQPLPGRDALEKRLTELWNFERYTPPRREGQWYFFRMNTGLQNQNVLFVARSLSEEPRVLLDPNSLSTNGTIALSGYSPTLDGTKIAYGLSKGGSDWVEWRVRDVESGVDHLDVLKWTKFITPIWSPDGKSLYYSRFPEPKSDGGKLEAINYNNQLYLHRLGTLQDDDELIYERPDHKEWMFTPFVSDDGRYLVITVTKSTEEKHRVLYRDLHEANSPLVELNDTFDNEYLFIDNDGPIFYFKTDHNAPCGKLIAIDINAANPRDPAGWRIVIPETGEKLEAVTRINDVFLAEYIKDSHSQVKVFNSLGQVLHEIKFPGLGTASGFAGHRHQTETFYLFTSYYDPGSIYRLDMRSFASTIYKKPQLHFNPDDFETIQKFATSKDGTKVPIFLTAKKGLERSGQTPTLLYGYGGFNISRTPWFNVLPLIFMEQGGRYAVAVLRGGGEYGQTWHEAGRGAKKQNVFDDFISVAEWLIQAGYTNRKHLAIQGHSNGGLLIGASVTQRPDLFGAALAGVGVLDMLRFHKFSVGYNWIDEYGSPDNPVDFKTLFAYSPLHNVKPDTTYPPILLTTGDQDDRVVPAHSYKFAAALQAAQKGESPILIRIERNAGHGAGKPISKQIGEAVDTLTFLAHTIK